MADTVPAVGKVSLALLRELWAADGRSNAFRLAVECQGDLGRLEAEVRDKEESIRSLSYARGPLAPGMSPRVYTDAYIAGLREAIGIIRSAEADTRPQQGGA